MTSSDLMEDFPEPGDRYTLQEQLGAGVYGKVFAASDSQASNRRVAVKVQKLCPDTQKLVQQEVRVLRELSGHANLPDFYGAYRKEAEVWFVMELCEKTAADLVRGLLAKNRRMAEEHLAHVIKEVVKVLVYLHENHVVHRDIKASNILLTREGEVKLGDFGLSHHFNDDSDKTGSCLGSPCWMAPETITSPKIQEGYDNRVDVWALGITAIELGEGKAPYSSMPPTRVLFQIVTNPPPTLANPPNWSENYLDFVNECLVKNPEHRPFMAEVIDHPFLEQVPENNYHLSTELKSLLHDVDGLKLPEAPSEVGIQEKFLKRGVDGDLEPMYVEDLASLDQISESSVMKELEARMENGNYQTFVGDVLVTLNPNDQKPIFGDKYHRKYCMKSRSDNAPHIYAIADSAYQNALHHLVPQKIVLSGESGSGKTSNYLHLWNHLLFLGDNKIVNLERLKDATKLIHALTHASTPINRYSTRCVLKTDLKYGTTGKVTSAVYNVYQLEKWRVSSVEMCQGNFHFLYYVYDGLDDSNDLEKYHLNPDHQHRYLRLSDLSEYNPDKNVVKFRKLLKILQDFDLTPEEIDTVLAVAAAVLTVGEIRFQATETGATIENLESVEHLGKLFEIDPKKFGWGLINYCLIRNGVAFKKKNTVDEARGARDVFANTLYSRLVDYIVGVINHKLAMGSSIFGEKFSIQIFDHFGFECFKKNHLPELITNCVNEQLQYHYLQRLFSWECLDVKEEELEYKPFQFYDNKATLDQLLSKTEGVLSFIDDAAKEGYGGPYVIDAIKNQENIQVVVAGTSEFSVAHYTGRVTYVAKEMPDKNRDFFPRELAETLRLSDNQIVKSFFSNKLNKTGNLVVLPPKKTNTSRKCNSKSSTTSTNYSQIKNKRTSISTFKALSLVLLKELSVGTGSGGTHFVRCIRTDLKGKPNSFNYELVRQQVRALAVVETAKARQRGFPHRIPFSEFLRRYQFLAFDFDENVEITKENCRLLLIRLKMEGWAIGKSKVFLKYYNEEYLARMYETQVRTIVKIQSIMRGFLTKCRIAKEVKNRGRKMEEDSKIPNGGQEAMSEDEAAVVIQRAYRGVTIRKSRQDYTILDEPTCGFIRGYANKWRKRSLFYVLLQYRSMRLQDSFNFSQQVHFYNLGMFQALQETNENIDLERIDKKAQVTQWLGERKPSVLKIPFRLDEIPYCDTSGMCNLPGVSAKKEESWNMPYQWREANSSEASNTAVNSRSDEKILSNTPYTRNPEEDIWELPNDPDLDNVTKAVKEYENKEVQKRLHQESSEVSRTNNKDAKPSNNRNKLSYQEIDCSAKLANKDFEYIKAPLVKKPRDADHVAELKQLARKDSSGSEDDPPFNFRGMLRKTNFQWGSIKKPEKEDVRKFSLSKKLVERSETSNGIGKKVATELAPGVFIEGIEVEL